MIRPVRPADVPVLVQFVHDLATYERAAGEVALTERSLRTALFRPAPAAFCHVAVGPAAVGPAAGGEQVVGFALWFLNFSTWTGRHGIYLEDLYVRPDARGVGHGRALLSSLAAICVDRDYSRLEWSVLDWNSPAIGFYRSLGAAPQDEWTVWRLRGEALNALGSQPVDSGPGVLPG